MIIMIIAELSGRCRQSPIVLGWEGQSLGTKDALSIGPLDTHWSHVFINPVRYALWELSSNQPECVHIHFVKAPIAGLYAFQGSVFRGSQYGTTPLCLRGWWRKLKGHFTKKKTTVIWVEVSQLFFTMNTKKLRGKLNRVEWPGSKVIVTVIHWSQSVMNLPHTILFSNTYWTIFWKEEKIMVYSHTARKY